MPHTSHVFIHLSPLVGLTSPVSDVSLFHNLEVPDLAVPCRTGIGICVLKYTAELHEHLH